eukprot:431292_1
MYTNAPSDPSEIKFQIEPYSESRRSSLRKWNIAAGTLHSIQSIMQLILGLTVDNFKNFRLPIQAYFLDYFENGDNSYLATTSKNLGNIRFGPLVFIFFFLSAFLHIF